MTWDPVLKLARFDQIGIAVRSVEAAVQYMQRSFGLEFITLDMPRASARLRGREVEFVTRIGMAKWGDKDLELMEIVEGDHIVKEFLQRSGPGLHHLGIYVDDLERALEPWRRAGRRVVQETTHPEGIGTVYLDAEEALGNVYIELIKL